MSGFEQHLWIPGLVLMGLMAAPCCAQADQSQSAPAAVTPAQASPVGQSVWSGSRGPAWKAPVRVPALQIVQRGSPGPE